MADPITERTAELEQGLDELQSQMNERVNAPAEPLIPPPAPVDPNAQTLITSINVEPPQEMETQAPESSEPAELPSWSEVKADPSFTSLTPEKKLAAFSRWHDQAYNIASAHPDWGTIKDQFNNGAAKTQAELSKAAGGITPEVARTKIANDALAEAEKTNGGPLNKEQTRAILTPLGNDVAKSYFDSLQPDTGIAHEVMNGIREFGTQFGIGLEKSVQGLAQMSADQLKTGDVGKDYGPVVRSIADTMMKIMPDAVKKNGQQFFQDAADYWQQRAANAGTESGIDPKLANTNGAQAAQIIAGVVRPVMNFPSFIVEHRLRAYAEAHDEGKSPQQSMAQADRATMGDILWTGLGHAVGAGLGPILKTQGVNGIRAWAVKASAAVSSNITAGQLISAAEAAANAPEGKGMEAFMTAFNKLDISDAAIQTGFGLVGAGSPFEAKPSGTEVAKKIIDEGKAAEAKAKAAGAPATAAAVADVTQKQAAATVVQAQAAEAKPTKTIESSEDAMNRIQAAKEAKMSEEPAENKITFGTTTDAEGEVVPNVEIPDDATLEHLQEAKAEVGKMRESADRNAYEKQLDNAIADMEAKQRTKDEQAMRNRTDARGNLLPAADQQLIENPEAAKPTEEELAARKKGSEAHREMRAKQAPEQTTTVAREGSKLPDLSYDGKWWNGREQFTELDPNAESHGATFDVPSNTTVEELKAIREAKRRAFSGEEQLPGFDERGNPTDEVIEAPQAMPASPESSAKNKAEHAAVRAEREAKLAETAKTEKAAGMTRAERSAKNKAEHKAKQAAASAARKALREPVAEATTNQVTQDVLKRGTAPTLAELKEAHPQLDITTAADMRRKMQAELKKAYPPAEVPKGSELTQVPHEYTQEDMSMVSTKGADGVTRTQPYFSNDPTDLAHKIDAGLVGKDKANRLYIPDDLVDNEKVNPAIFKDARFDKETNQYYVGDVETEHGRVGAPDEYTQLRKERDQFSKAHATVFTDKWEGIADAVNHEAEAEGIPTDQIHIDKPDPDFEPNGTEIESNPEQSHVTHTLQNVQEAHDLGIIGDEAEMYKTSGAKGHVMAVVDNMIKDPKTQPYMAEILKLIKSSRFDKQLRKMKLDFGTIGNDNQFAGRYEYDTDTIRLNPVGGHDGGLRATFFHELIHGVLDQKLLNHGLHNAVEAKALASLKLYHDIISRGLFKIAKGHDPSAGELAEFRKAQRNMDHPDYQGHDHYPIYDLREFVNGATNNEGFMNIISRLELNAEPKDRPLFAKIRDLVKNAIKRFFAGKEIPEGSVLDHTLDHIFTLIEEGGETAAGKFDIGAHNRAILEQRATIKRRQDLFKKPEPQPKPTPKPPVGGKLTREQRSQINKAAYKRAQEIVKINGGDVMAEFVRQRDKILARVADPRMLTAEGRVQLADASKRATQRAEEGIKAKEETGLTADELNAEITGGEPAPEPTYEFLKEREEKKAGTIHPTVKGDGWVMPDGRFLQNDQYVGSTRVVGLEAPTFGGHEGTMWDHIMENEELAKKFEKWAVDRGFENMNEMDASDIKAFAESQGYLRVLNEGRNLYFTGDPRKNTSGMKMLQDHAVERERRLVHDRETGTALGTRTVYEPPTMTGEIEPPEAQQAKEEEPTGKIKYKGRTKGRANVEFEGAEHLTKAQFDAVTKQIDEDTRTSDATKTALKDQLAVAAKQGDPVYAERSRFTRRDTGTETIVAGANSAKNIPRIVAEQQANRIAQDFGGKKGASEKDLKTLRTQVALDRSAMNFIIDEGRDLKRLEIARDQIANSVDPEMRKADSPEMRAINHAIDNFDRLKGLDTHDKVMKEQLERDHAYEIDTPEVKDYVTRQLDSPDVDEHTAVPVPNGMGGMRYFTKARSFETLADAINKGFKPKTMDIVELAQHRIEASERIIQQKILGESMKSVMAPDGKPIVSTPTTRQTLYHGEQDAVPRGYVSVPIPGSPPLIVHADYAPIFKALYGDSHQSLPAKYAGWIKRNTLVADSFHVGRIGLKELFYGKGMGRLGYDKGLSILEYRKADLAKALEQGDIDQGAHDFAMKHYEDAQALIRNGLNVASISDNMSSEIARALPFLKNFNPWVFKKMSRGAMMQTALANLTRNQSRFGAELTRDEVLRKTAKEMNEVFGNLQLQSVFKDPKVQDALRAILLAPQWAESQLKTELRGYGQIAKIPIDALQGKFRVGAIAQGQMTAVLGTFMAMQVASMIMNGGKTTFQNKKGDFLNLHIPDFMSGILGKPVAKAGFDFNPFEIGAEYAMMAYRYHSQHMQIADVLARIGLNKLNPATGALLSAALNRDYAGKRYATTGDRLRALASNTILPLPPSVAAGMERDPRQTFTMKEASQLGAPTMERKTGGLFQLAAHTAGLRPARAAGSVEKNILQAFGAKVSYAQTPRGEMFALAHPFRDDKDYGDNAPPIYRDLRTALDNHDEDSVRQEIQLLANRGATEDQIKGAVGIKHGGIAPERFSKGKGQKDREKFFVQSLTPEQKETYKQAQADHKANANMLRATLSQMKLSDSELVKQLRKNAANPKKSDFEE